MAVNPTVLLQAKQAENAETTQYTSPSSTRTIIDKFTGYNASGATATLTIRLVASGGSGGVTNAIVAKSLAAGETYTFPEVVGHVLGPGDFISTLASAATAINIRASGRQVT